MSDELNPLADLPAAMPESNVREYAAALVRNGMAVDEANKHFTARGAAPLASDTLEMAIFKRDQLLFDPVFADKFMRGEPEATAQINLLDARIAKGGGKLLDRDPSPGDYKLNVAWLAPEAPSDEVQKFTDDMSKLAADLKLPQEHARAMVAQHIEAVQQTAGMTDEERAIYGRQQTSILERALGPDAETRMKDASAVLSRVSGRTLDLAKIVQSNGAEVALTLLQQAEHLRIALGA